MTLESLLILVLLLALPLLDRLVRALRARLIAAVEQATPAVRPGPPPLPAAEPPPSLRRAPARHEWLNRPAEPETIKHPAGRPTRGARLRSNSPVGNLRRAVVLMTILGPCRALDRDAGGQR